MTDPNTHNRLVVVSNPTAVKNKIRVSVDLAS